jgi:hypothetical protein
MKNRFTSFWSKGLFVLCVLALWAGFRLAGCDNGSTDGGGGGVTIDFASPGANQISFTLSRGEWGSLAAGLPADTVLGLCAISNGMGDFAAASDVYNKTKQTSARSNGNKTLTVTIEKRTSGTPLQMNKTGSFDIKLKSSVDATFASFIIGYTSLSEGDVGGISGSNLAIGTNTAASITIN